MRIIRLFVILGCFISTATLYSQTPANFSGQWKYEKAKSTPDTLEPKFDGMVILRITQNVSTIAFSEIYKKQGSADFKTASDTYSLDGKEKVKKDETGISRKSAKWSQDKKILTITNHDTPTLEGVAQDFLIVDSYKLSDDGRTLTLERYYKNPVTGEARVKKLYSKK
ncbi:MAG: hypothetical protein NTZ35_02060 [Ignavibacteriales bacterium]|nr:hypothetical protein [Ignavibacteriales bacterium]